MLASGADVSIGGFEYVLAKVDNRYVHRYESLFAPTQAVAGEVAGSQLRPEKILWSWTDWSGGEGARIYYPTDPTTYDVGSLINPIERGVLTTRPRRYRSSVARAGSQADTASRPAGGSAWNKALIAWEDNVLYSRTATAWQATAALTNGQGAHYQTAATDGRFLVLGKAVESVTDIVPAIDGSATTPTAADVFSGTTLINAPWVAATLEGIWYTWGLTTSNVLSVVQGTTLGSTSAGSAIYSPGLAVSGALGTDYWLDMVQAEQALYASLGTPSTSMVFEILDDVGSPFWTAPPGFTIQKLIYHLGVLFAVGTQTAGSQRFATLYSISLANRDTRIAARPRRHRTEELPTFSLGCAGNGAFIFLGDENSGKVFLYDMDAEGLHLFDDLALEGDDGTTFTAYAGLLPANVAGVEGASLAATGWTTETVSVARSTVSPRDGVSHLVMSGNAVAVTATGQSGVLVEPSTAYTASCYHKFFSGGSAQTTTLSLRWYDSTGSLISTSSSSPTAPSNTYAQVTLTATSPSTAAFAALAVSMAIGVGGQNFYDSFALQPGSSVTQQDKLAFLAMHGSRLFGATYQPDTGTDTSLQVVTWDDPLRELRDGSQAVEASAESAEWDFSLPHERKNLNGFYVTYQVTDTDTDSGLVADSRITVSYAIDGGEFVDLPTIDEDTIVTTQGRHFLPVSVPGDTVQFIRMRMKVTLDNNGQAVQPPVLFSIVAEANVAAYTESWELQLQIAREDQHYRPSDRQTRSSVLRDHLLNAATSGEVLEFVDGIRYEEPNQTSVHQVVIEDPMDIIGENNDGVMRVRLRAVPV